MTGRFPLLLAAALLAAVGAITAFIAFGAEGDDHPPQQFLPNTPTSVPWKTVTAPEAPAAGRDDCPQDWLAYTDPGDRYSICYPADSRVTASDLALNVRSPEPASQEQAGFTITVSWEERLGVEPSQESCPDLVTGMGHVSSTFVELNLSGRAVPACDWQSATDGIPSLPLGSRQGVIPVADDGSDRVGFISFVIYFGGPDVPRVPDLGQAIVDTLSVNFR